MKLETLIGEFEAALKSFEQRMSLPLTGEDEGVAFDALEHAMGKLALADVDSDEDWAQVLSMVVRDEPVWRAWISAASLRSRCAWPWACWR